MTPASWIMIAKAAAVALLIAAVVWWWNSFIDRQQAIGYQRAADHYAALLAEAKDAALITERNWNTKLKGATDARTETETLLAKSRASAAAAADRLRRTTDDFSQRLPAASIETCRTAAETAAGLLNECGGKYRELAAAADGHLADFGQCEAAWPG